MSDANDGEMNMWEWRRRGFGVPWPPEKPYYVDGVDNIHWSQFSRRFAARLNATKTSFAVDPYDPSDTTAHRLGPPSAAPDYHPLIEKYGLHVLEAAGFLNRPFDPDLFRAHIDGRLAYELWRNPHRHQDIQIRLHPVLRRKQWVGITDYRYSLMFPALQLATAILDDPVTLCYSHALAMPRDSMDTVSHDSAGLKAECKIMKVRNDLDIIEQGKTFQKLNHMTVWLRDWGFEENISVYGHTGRVEDSSGNDVPAWGSNTARSWIRINHAFIDILTKFEAAVERNNEEYQDLFEEIMRMAGIPESSQVEINFEVVPISFSY